LASLCAVWLTDIFMPQRIQNIVPLTILSNHERLFLFFSFFFRNVFVYNKIRNLSISNCISHSWSKECDIKFRCDSKGDKDAGTTRFTSYELNVWQCRLICFVVVNVTIIFHVGCCLAVPKGENFFPSGPLDVITADSGTLAPINLMFVDPCIIIRSTNNQLDAAGSFFLYFC
jgi:hypothetical protein